MKKRILSYILAAVLLFSAAFGAAAEGFVGSLIDKLLEYTPADRQNMLMLVSPMLITDNGIDVIVSLIEDYDPNSQSEIDRILGAILGAVDKEEAIKAVKSIKVIDESIREKYINALLSRTALPLSPSLRQDVKICLDALLYAKYPNLKALFESDGITEGVVANMLNILVDINGGKPCLTDDAKNKNDLAVGILSQSLTSKADPVLKDLGRGGVRDVFAEVIAKINSDLTNDQKAALKRVGAAVGFYLPAVSTIPEPWRPGPGNPNSGNNDDKGAQIRYLEADPDDVACDADLADATIVEITLFYDGVKQAHGPVGHEFLAKILVDGTNVTAYKIDTTLTPVKYSVYSDGVLSMRIDSTGYYALRSEENHFSDVSGWGSFYVESLYRRGIVSGIDEHTFMPLDNIKREQLVKLVVELTNTYNAEAVQMPFSDVREGDWFYPYVAAAYQAGLVDGMSKDYFGAGEYITRQDLCKIIYSFIKANQLDKTYIYQSALFEDQKEISPYAAESVDALYRLGIICGDDLGRFRPLAYATRQEAAKIIYGVLQLYVNNV